MTFPAEIKHKGQTWSVDRRPWNQNGDQLICRGPGMTTLGEFVEHPTTDDEALDVARRLIEDHLR